MWFARSIEAAKEYGPHIHRVVTVQPARLLVFDDYGEALRRLGWKTTGAASRELVRAIRTIDVDGYWYRNPVLNSEEIMLLRPASVVSRL